MSKISTESAAQVQPENVGITGQAVSAVLQAVAKSPGKSPWRHILPPVSVLVRKGNWLKKKRSIFLSGLSLNFATSLLQCFLEILHEMNTDFLFSKNLAEVAQVVEVCTCVCTQTYRHI